MNGYSQDLRKRMLRDTEDFLSRHLDEARPVNDEILPNGKSNVSRATSNIWVCILTGKRVSPGRICILVATTHFK